MTSKDATGQSLPGSAALVEAEEVLPVPHGMSAVSEVHGTMPLVDGQWGGEAAREDRTGDVGEPEAGVAHVEFAAVEGIWSEPVVDNVAVAAAQSGRPLPSPVPQDHDLWEGVEQPFTVFGQFGVDMLDQRVFAQDVWWVDRLGRPHRLDEMGEQYRRNVLQFLTESAEQRWLDEVRLEAITAFTDAMRGKVSFAVLADAAGARRVRDTDPVTWLESTPLVRRLRQLTGQTPNSCASDSDRIFDGGPEDVAPSAGD